MEEISYFFSHLFDAENWPPRWFCGTWTDFHGWLYILSDLLIWAAYFTIPFILIYFISKRKNELPFVRIFWLFVLFILACGFTHLVDATMFWYPAYRLSAVWLFITGLISWAAVIGLIKVMPAALSFKSPAELEEIISQRTEELEKSNRHLKKLNTDLDHFVYAASHDLKSPVNNVEGLFQLIRMETDMGQVPDKDLLDKVQLSIDRIHATISNLTHVIRVQQNNYDDLAELRFESLLNEILQDNERLIAQRPVSFVNQFEVETVNYSQTGLKSILYNLVTNAVKYASPERDPVINISTQRDSKGAVVLAVKDNGMGMDLERNGTKLFTLFKRFHTQVEGTGIGLYMIKKLVEEKGGSIQVESQPGQGSVFYVTL